MPPDHKNPRAIVNRGTTSVSRSLTAGALIGYCLHTCIPKRFNGRTRRSLLECRITRIHIVQDEAMGGIRYQLRTGLHHPPALCIGNMGAT